MRGKLIGNILSIENNRKCKFEKDTISYDADDYLIKSWGVFLNIAECLAHFECGDAIELIKKLSKQNCPISSVLYGAYIIVVFDKKTNQLNIFNDLLSKYSIYYYYNDKSGQLFFSDSFFETFHMIKEHKMSYNFDVLGVKMMMWYGMFYDDITYIHEIKFLRPFDYIIIKNGKLEMKRIERQAMLSTSIKAASKEVNERFAKAVRLQYQKNAEYGYPQVITLSGGMDSRTTFLYGLSYGYKDQAGYCYGESTSMDFEDAKQLAVKYNCKFFFHTIDSGNHLIERDDICKANEAQAVYSGPSGTYESLRFYNTCQWGIVHTGLGGGEIMGDMRIDDNPTKWEMIIESLKYRLGKGKKDRTWESFVSSLQCTDEEVKRLELFYKDYKDFNEFQSLCDMRRCLNSQKMGQFFGVEYVSPFLYEEFFCYMLRIPYNLTKGRRLYLYWQKKYNPKQFETPSTFQMGCKPNNKIGYFIKRFYKYVVNKMGKKTKWDMNPEEFWFSINPKILEKQEQCFRSDMGAINNKISSDIYKYINDRWSTGDFPRSNILTATWSLRKLYED